MSETPTPPAVPPQPAPAAPPKPAPVKPQARTKFIPPAAPPAQTRPVQAEIAKRSHRGLVGDVAVALAAKQESDVPESLKAALNEELKNSGAKAAILDVHRHQIKTKNGNRIILHVSLTPMF